VTVDGEKGLTLASISREQADKFHAANKHSVPQSMVQAVNIIKQERAQDVPREITELKDFVRREFASTTEAIRILIFIKLYNWKCKTSTEKKRSAEGGALPDEPLSKQRKPPVLEGSLSEDPPNIKNESSNQLTRDMAKETKKPKDKEKDKEKETLTFTKTQQWQTIPPVVPQMVTGGILSLHFRFSFHFLTNLSSRGHL